MNETLLVLQHAGDPSRCVPPLGEAPPPHDPVYYDWKKTDEWK